MQQIYDWYNEKENNEKTGKNEKRDEKKKSKSEQSKEKKKEVAPSEWKEVSYPLVPSRKDKERHLTHFLDIFKKLEITMPFGDALQSDDSMKQIQLIHH